MSRATLSTPALLLIAALVPAGSASAGPYGEHGPQPQFDLRLPDGTVARPNPELTGRLPGRAAPAWDRFTRLRGDGPGVWRGLWNRDAGTPSRVYGDYVSAPGATADSDAALAAARELLFSHLDLLAPGARSGDFVLAANHLSQDGRYRSVGFDQTHRGMPVLGGQISVRIKNDRVFVLASTARPNVDVPTPELRVTASDLGRIAEGWIRDQRGGAPVARPDVDGPMILPILTDLGYRYEPVVRVVVDVADPFEEWDVFLNPETGEPVAREQKLMYASGTVQFDVVDRYPANGRIELPAPDLTLSVTTGGTTADRTTDARGLLTWPGEQPATLANANQPGLNLQGTVVSSGLSGPNIRVADLANLATTNFGGTLDPDGVVTFGNPNDQFQDANYNTYQAIEVVRQRVLDIDPGNSWVSNNQLLAFTNANSLCNAVANGQFIFMFQGGSPQQGVFCENTGRIDDVVFHELGHNIHANLVIPGVGEFVSDYSEGLSDYLAGTITGDSGMARGFFGTNQPLRELDPPVTNTWSRVGGDPVQHTRGLAYAGAQWDLRKNLVAKLGAEDGVAEADRLWIETLRRADAILTTFIETVAANDDDGDLSNGTPDYCEIQNAFGTHELAVGEGFGLSVGLIATDGLEIRVPVSLPAIDCGSPSQEVDEVRVYWSRADAPDQQETLVLEADGDAYVGTLPADAIEVGTVVRYRVEVLRGDGTTIDLPRNAADPTYELFFGDVDELFCTDFEQDPFQQGFSSDLLVGDPNQPGNNDWQWGPSEATDVDPPAAFSGDNVVGNDLGPAMGSVRFNGLYRRGVVNRLLVPPVDGSGYDQVRLHYRRWLAVVDRFFSEVGGNIDQATILSNDVVAWESNDNATRSVDHVDEEWRFHTVDLTPTRQDGEVNIAFELSTSPVNFGTRGGWTVDDLCVVGFNRPVCGDGVVNTPEVCDDGNTVDFDGCQADCTVSPEPVCGNGVVESGETCDDGNASNGDGCENDCTETPPAVCGNGVVEMGETCDDGNQIDGDGCEAGCTSTPAPVCGNGVVEIGEACDDGNAVDDDTCTNACEVPTPPEDPDPDPNPPGGSGDLQRSDDGCVCVGGAPSIPLASMLLLAGLGLLAFGRRPARHPVRHRVRRI